MQFGPIKQHAPQVREAAELAHQYRNADVLVLPAVREVSSASSTCLRVARPISTITSVRKRGVESRRDGRVIPDQALSSSPEG